MNKLNITINLSKLDKSKIIDKVYKNKYGVEVKDKLYKAVVVELKEPKFVAEGENWLLKKTHFIVDPQTKEEREQKKESNYIGDGMVFESKDDQQDKLPVEDTNDSIPF